MSDIDDLMNFHPEPLRVTVRGVDRWTGKPTYRSTAIPGKASPEKCEDHGVPLVSDCAFCGAPVCCPACCEEARDYGWSLAEQMTRDAAGEIEG